MELYFLRYAYVCKTSFSNKQYIHTYIYDNSLILWQLSIYKNLNKYPRLSNSLPPQGLNSVREASQPSLMSMRDVRKEEGRGEYPWCARSSLKRNGTKRVGERKAETSGGLYREKEGKREKREGKRCCSLPAGARGNYKIAKINHKTWPAWCALP